MAARSYLTPTQWEEAISRLTPPPSAFRAKSLLGGRAKRPLVHPAREFSLWLGDCLKARLEALPGWREAQPIALGSWSRDELCPLSDIDLLFVGDEVASRDLVRSLQEEGLPIRHRTPQDFEDWTVGVGAFDVMALLGARPFFEETQPLLADQRQKVKARGKGYWRTLLQSMREERQDRSEKYDSISNYLEPSIKYGPGGLRDLQQAIMVTGLYSDKFDPHFLELRSLRSYLDFYLLLRHKLHLETKSDRLVASYQKELAEWCGYKGIQDFMKEVQIGLFYVNFYADWVVERAKAGAKRLALIDNLKITQLSEAVEGLKKDNTVLMQQKVSISLENLRKNDVFSQPRVIGRMLHKIFELEENERFFIALFRSGLLEECLPEFKKIKGLVQHDQYHRFTVVAHILQCLRELLRIKGRPSRLGELKSLWKEIDLFDLRILAWTCLYHDMAKGGRQDHSLAGERLVESRLTDFGLSQALTSEVAWMVRHHLLLSQAAFRRNPRETRTWQDLHDKGVMGKRLTRLALFTAIDIRATNPEAWTHWKERLLFETVQVVRSPQATRFMKLLSQARNQKVQLSQEFLEGMDPALVEAIPFKHLLNDYKKLRESSKDLPVLVVTGLKGYLWVRIHRRKDQKGLFLEFVKMLFAAGCSVIEASAQTYERYGPYDWFKVKSQRKPAQLKKLLSLVSAETVEVPSLQFEQIQPVSQTDRTWTLSFVGKDRPGALLTAVKALSDEGLPISWARVHTWGRRIDDIFCVEKPQDTNKVLQSLRAKHVLLTEAHL